MTSPVGGSTLITSAPKSARIWVAYGPMTTVVRSITLTPSRGPAIGSLRFRTLFGLDAGELHQARPMHDLGLNEFSELCRVHRRDIDSNRGEFFLHLRRRQALYCGVVEPLHDLGLRLRWRHDGEPCNQLVPGELFSDRGQVGSEGRTLCRCDREAAKLAALRLRERVAEIHEGERKRAAHGV